MNALRLATWFPVVEKSDGSFGVSVSEFCCVGDEIPSDSFTVRFLGKQDCSSYFVSAYCLLVCIFFRLRLV